jgi:CHAD domain-containing protein
MDELRRLGQKLESVETKLREHAGAAPTPRQTDHHGWRWALDARVARRAARLGSAIDAAGTVYLPDRLHDVRISLKKFRYALEIASEALSLPIRDELRSLKRAQDVLGRLHDFQVLIDQARQAQASLTPPDLMTWRGLEALVNVLEDDCRRLHARYVRERDGLTSLCTRFSGRGKPTTARRVTA